MKIQFTYFNPDEINPLFNSFPLALSVVEKQKLIIDTAYLPVIEAAHQGYLLAVCEMASLFGTGAPGLPKNYSQARFYTDVMKDYNRGDPETEVEALYNSGCLEFRFGNFEIAKSEFIQAAKIMANNLNPEDWNFNVFYYLQRLASQENEEGEIK